MNRIKTALMIPLAALTVTHVVAIELELVPASTQLSIGDSVSLDLVISGLRTGVAPSLGVFDVNIAYDFGILALNSGTFGTGPTGDQLDILGLGSVTEIDSTSPGLINLYELSLDSPADLNQLQVDSFVLGTLSFTAIGDGVSSLTLTDVILGDANGTPLVPDLVKGAVVTVGKSMVPEGGMLLPGLFVVGVAVAGTLLRRLKS